MKKVNNIIQIVKKSYDIYADDFHEYFTDSFNRSLISNCGFGRSFDIDHEVLNKFIDKCVYYRLGISDIMPQKSDIVYDLSKSASPEDIAMTTDDVYSKLVYCAYPAKLIKKLKSQLEANKLSESVVDLITSKLEISND